MKHPTRLQYWSHSKLSKKIRLHFGLTNPIALSAEGWEEHEEECKQKAPFIHWVTDEGFDNLQDLVMFPSDLWWNIRTATIWKFFRNLWTFKECLWNYRSWDYCGLLQFMEVASMEMHKCHKNHGHLMRSEETAKELLIFSTLCKRIREDNYSLERLNHVEGKSLFTGRLVNKPNTLPTYNTKSYHKLCRGMKKNDMELLGKLIARKIDSFWD